MNLGRLSYNARLVFAAIAEGKKLRVPRDGSRAELKDPPNYPQSFGQVCIDPAIVKELIGSGLLHKITPHGTENRMGWIELGFTDGYAADYYCCEF